MVHCVDSPALVLWALLKLVMGTWLNNSVLEYLMCLFVCIFHSE